MSISRNHIRITCVIVSIFLIFGTMLCFYPGETTEKGSTRSQEKTEQVNPFANRFKKASDFGTCKSGEVICIRFSTDRTASYKIKGRAAADLSVIFYLFIGLHFFFGTCQSIAICNKSWSTLQVLRYIHESDGEK